MDKSLFKYLIFAGLFFALLAGCEEFQPADAENWEGGYDDYSDAGHETGDTIGGNGYYIPDKYEEYFITISLADSNKIIYKNELNLRGIYATADSLYVVPGKKYTISFFCKWQGAKIGNSIQLSAGPLYRYITLTHKEESESYYLDSFVPKSPKLQIRYGVLRTFQDIDRIKIN